MKIKYENMLAVYHEVVKSSARGENITRAGIAERTALSLMTVGKAIDLLVESGFAMQIKRAEGSVGRRSGQIYLSTDIGFHLCDGDFSVTTDQTLRSAFAKPIMIFEGRIGRDATRDEAIDTAVTYLCSGGGNFRAFELGSFDGTSRPTSLIPDIRGDRMRALYCDMKTGKLRLYIASDGAFSPDPIKPDGGLRTVDAVESSLDTLTNLGADPVTALKAAAELTGAEITFVDSDTDIPGVFTFRPPVSAALFGLGMIVAAGTIATLG